MKIKLFIIILISTFVIQLYSRDALNYSGNPIIQHIFTADPCAMVYYTLYLFTGHDEQNTTSEWFYMHNWHVFSTTYMVNYTDHGAQLSYTDFRWASGNAFAGHCIYNNGKFWWYVPMTHKTDKVNEGFAIGVAVSDHPTGPYTDAIGEALITDYTTNSIPLNIDPAVFIDDDGTMKKIVQTTEGVPELVAGIGEPGAVTDYQIKIFPNPLNGNILNIELPQACSGREVEISIHDIEGRIIYRDHFYRFPVNRNTEIQFTDPLYPGCYILIFRSGQLFHSSLIMVTGRRD